MDSNTRDVLMVIINLVIVPLVVFYINWKQSKRIEAVKTEVQSVKSGVEEYHKAVNGNMEKLLQTTKELATAQEKARGEAEKI